MIGLSGPVISKSYSRATKCTARCGQTELPSVLDSESTVECYRVIYGRTDDENIGFVRPRRPSNSETVREVVEKEFKTSRLSR